MPQITMSQKAMNTLTPHQKETKTFFPKELLKKAKAS
jgi:hypothetical protein